MSIRVAVCCTLLYLLLDVVVTTVLFIHGSQLSIFKEEVLNFSILRSVLDLWGTMLLRVVLLLGACIGVLWNREDGPQRVTKLTTSVVLICLIVITYALVKLLMLTEVRPLTQQPWVLSLLCWTFASSLGVLLPWNLLAKQSKSVQSHSSRGDDGSEDTEKLVETASEEEAGCEGEQSTKGQSQDKQPGSGATLGRLLMYVRKDGGLLSVAVLFLLISAVCEFDFDTVKTVQ